MNVLVGCESSGIIRDAFLRRGHNAYSCDLKPTRRPGPHLQCDLLSVLDRGWDLMIAHPPCTHLAVSGNRWRSEKPQHLIEEAILFVAELLLAPIERIAIENPPSIISSRIGPATQTIHSKDFGHYEKKRFCLWLKHLPLLKPTKRVEFQDPIFHMAGQQKGREEFRSTTLLGVAEAMAEQWGAA